MDFSTASERVIDGYACYAYERLDPAALPDVYVAYHDALSEPTEVFHNDIRGRFDRGEPAVVAAMQRFAAIAEHGRAALLAGDLDALDRLVNENFDTRRCGASAKFAGSGGAIVGLYRNHATLDRLRSALSAIHCRLILPIVS
jgi:glucuronokinase